MMNETPRVPPRQADRHRYAPCLDRAAYSGALFDCTDCPQYRPAEPTLTDCELRGILALASHILKCPADVMRDALYEYRPWAGLFFIDFQASPKWPLIWPLVKKPTKKGLRNNPQPIDFVGRGERI
jgi:hypothetical protein